MIQKDEFRLEILKILSEKLDFAKSNFQEAQDSVTSETKGSVGDKHETSRAMAQIELENAGKILKEAEMNIDSFKKITNSPNQSVNLGSLIFTNFEIFYVSIGLGKIIFQNEAIFCLNLNSPLGKILFGKSKGDTFVFNSKNYLIQEIY
jgi:hypothetical protein